MVTVEATPALPPGSNLPPFVQTVLFLAFRRQAHAYWRRKYGEVFTARVAGARTIVTLSRPEHIRQVFAGTPAVFHAGEGNGLLAPVMGRHSLLTTDEDVHLQARKLLMPAFNGAALRGYRDMMTELAVQNVERWPKNVPFPVHPLMNAVTLEIILRVVFGMSDGERLRELRPRLRRISDIGPVAVLGWSYPKLRGHGVWKRNWENLHAVDRLLYAEIADRRAEGDLSERGDVLSRLLTAAGDELTDVELRDHMITLLLAGHETTATALAWSFHELARRPALQRQAQEGDDAFLEAVAKEAMRRRPVIQNVARKLTEPTEIADFLLPAGTVVAPSISLVHRDASVYTDPKDFRPERFLGKSPEAGTWIPFGGGVRRCIGAGFSLQEAVAVLREALSRYDIYPEHERPEHAKVRNITLIPARGGRIVVTPR
jgi:cytochrome P450